MRFWFAPLSALLLLVSNAAAQPPPDPAAAEAPATSPTPAPGPPSPAPNPTAAPESPEGAAAPPDEFAGPAPSEQTAVPPAAVRPPQGPSTASSSLPAGARAQETAPRRVDDATPFFAAGPLGRHQDHYFVGAGARVDLVRDARFDLFASNDALPQFGIYLGRTLFAQGDLSVSPIAGWHWGTRSDQIRDSDETSLDVHRLMLGGEGRYHLIPRWLLFSRLVLGGIRAKAEIEDVLSGARLASEQWVFAADLTAGTAFEIFGPSDGERAATRVWLTAEGGYAFTSAAELSFSPVRAKDAPERSAARDAGELSLSGATMRYGLTVGY